jgi:hypothetical protein
VAGEWMGLLRKANISQLITVNIAGQQRENIWAGMGLPMVMQALNKASSDCAP